MEKIKREAAFKIEETLGKYPIIALTGPRQSGKTILCKMIAPEFTYVNLEDFSNPDFAKSVPKGFLQTYKNCVIIDEIQYAPDLF